MVITTKSGTVAEFLIADTPEITYQNNLLKVVGGGSEISVEAQDVSSFDFIGSDSSDVDGISVDGPNLSGLLPGTLVEVYTFEGQKVASFNADESGSVFVGMGDLAPGFYIVRTPGATFKIKKN